MKQLLADDFFMPEELIGIRVEIKNRDADLNDVNTEVCIQSLFARFYFTS